MHFFIIFFPQSLFFHIFLSPVGGQNGKYISKWIGKYGSINDVVKLNATILEIILLENSQLNTLERSKESKTWKEIFLKRNSRSLLNEDFNTKLKIISNLQTYSKKRYEGGGFILLFGNVYFRYMF